MRISGRSKSDDSHFGRVWNGLGLILIATVGFATVADCAGAPRPSEVLRTLNSRHPRLMLDQAALDNIRRSIGDDPVAARIHEKVLAAAEKALKVKPAVFELRDGRRLLYVSGEVLERVSTLAYAFRMTGNKDYAERAWADLDAAAGFKDWNPAHFLDTAVMTCALAIGYDWLWDQWTPDQRARLRGAIVKLGLEPAMKVYSDEKGWHRVDYNWNQVCNGGIALGALAVADDEPKISSRILVHAITSLPRAMGAYMPDGAGKEGVGYWAFGSRYNVLMLASLRSALGTDFGLAEADGFKQSGDYQIYMSGAGRSSYDFGDCNRSPLSTAQHLWMGRHYGIQRYSLFRYIALKNGAGGDLWDLMWFDPDAREAPVPELPPDRHFRVAECVTMRDEWIDSSGFNIAMQGGANRWTHRHFDLGSFILEADGVRWIIDSGKERETYQRHANHTAREDFYRVRAEGHNTLVINPGKDPGQSLDAKAAFGKFDSKPEGAFAKLDLSSAYQKGARHVSRTFELVRGKTFTVTDEVTCRKPADIWSYFHTEAEVELSADKRRATLRQAGKSLFVYLVSPADAAFEVLPALPGPKSPVPAKQASNDGRRKLAVHLKDVKSAGIKVVFSRFLSD